MVRLSLEKIGQCVLLCFLAATVSACAVSTASYGTGQSAESALARDFTNIVTLGLVDGAGKNQKIRYEERKGLVVPREDQLARIPRPGERVEIIPAEKNEDGILNDGPTLINSEDLAKAEAEELAAEKLPPAAITLPGPKKKRSIRSQLGFKKKEFKKPDNNLLDLPPEYRTVQNPNVNSDVNELLTGKKKKKKRFLFF